ncbi:MAG: type I restriction enzyme HsdR N-terminal domain-containing protein [Rikenellaceae bacterium]
MPKAYPKLNFPSIKLRAQRSADGRSLMVWSAPRNCYLLLTPEEWVRRHLVEYLTTHFAIATPQIIEEYPIPLNGQPQRADVVVVSGSTPIILVECKAPDVKITRHTLDQAARYNSVLGAKYIILTNGITHLCFEFSDGKYLALKEFPDKFL